MQPEIDFAALETQCRDFILSFGDNNKKKELLKPQFGVVDVSEEHPWGAVIFGSIGHQKAVNKNRAVVRPYINNKEADDILKSEKEKLKKINSQVSKALGKKKTPLHTSPTATADPKKLSKQEKQIFEHGELFRPPYSPKNRFSQKSIRQSFFSPITTVSVRFATTGAVSNLVTSFVGRIHAVIHGEQRVVLIPPAFAVTTRDPVSINDFEEKSSKATDITEFQEDWEDRRVLHKCTLLPGDIMFIPAYWSFGFESHNGESVSVTGRILWK